MCGIAGILGRLGEPNRAALRRMSAALRHRGPDSEGSWESTPDARGRGALLAFRRLAILDLSESGHQPMVDPVTGQVIVFNGEIYNYVALRKELVAQGQAFASSGDTAVMLRALSLLGRAGLEALRGMFAFGLWDPARRRLTLARDRLGIKPLYLARNPDPDGEWTLAFASEVRALLAAGLLGRPRLHPRAAASMVWNGFMVAPDTAIAGVESLLPGEVAVCAPGGREVSREIYADLPRVQAAGPAAEAGLAESLAESVRLHLASDVPLAVFLSGGVDSSAIANLARKAADAPVHTFTLAFHERDHDEGPIARRVAAALGTLHHEVVLTESDFIARLEGALDSLDQPTFDGLNSYYLARAVREAGFTVALAGTGGDELFGGYASFRDLPRLLRAAAGAAWVPMPLVQLAARAIAACMQPSRADVGPQTRWAKLPDMAAQRSDLIALYQLSYALFLPDFQRRLLGEAARQAVADGLPGMTRERLRREIAGRAALPAVSVLEQRLFLGERLLRDTDAASMAASIEARLPLVDQAVVHSAYAVPDARRYARPAKALLRRAGLQGVEPSLFDRPKAGFVLPFDRWLKTGLGRAIDAAMTDAGRLARAGLDAATVTRLWRAYQGGAPGMYWTRIWALYVLVRWCERHGVEAQA